MQTVLVVPVLLLLLMLVFQFALWYYANEVASAAAQDGARAARVDTGTADVGADRANILLDQTARSLLQHRQVLARRDAESARVEVRGVCISLVPGLHLPVDAVATSSTERFIGRQAGG